MLWRGILVFLALALGSILPAASEPSGTYSGKVARFTNGNPTETRTYSVTINADRNTGKVLIYNVDGSLRSNLGIVGKFIDTRTFQGKTTAINAPPGYIPDIVTLVFSADWNSVVWHHDDGTTKGDGKLSR
jgi:hypothetical protein